MPLHLQLNLILARRTLQVSWLVNDVFKWVHIILIVGWTRNSWRSYTSFLKIIDIAHFIICILILSYNSLEIIKLFNTQCSIISILLQLSLFDIIVHHIFQLNVVRIEILNNVNHFLVTISNLRLLRSIEITRIYPHGSHLIVGARLWWRLRSISSLIITFILLLFFTGIWIIVRV